MFPLGTVWFNAGTVAEEGAKVCNFVHICDKKQIGVQVVVDRDLVRGMMSATGEVANLTGTATGNL